MKAKQEAIVQGVVVSKRREAGQNAKVTVLCGDGSKVDLRHKKLESIPFAMVCDILPGDSVEMTQGDVYSLKVRQNPSRYSVDGCKPVALWVIVFYNPEMSEETIEAIASLEIGATLENMHDATILRIK